MTKKYLCGVVSAAVLMGCQPYRRFRGRFGKSP